MLRAHIWSEENHSREERQRRVTINLRKPNKRVFWKPRMESFTDKESYLTLPCAIGQAVISSISQKIHWNLETEMTHRSSELINVKGRTRTRTGIFWLSILCSFNCKALAEAREAIKLPWGGETGAKVSIPSTPVSCVLLPSTLGLLAQSRWLVLWSSTGLSGMVPVGGGGGGRWCSSVFKWPCDFS